MLSRCTLAKRSPNVKLASTIPADIILRQVLIDQRLDPGERFFGEFHHSGVSDFPIRIKSNSDPDWAVERILGEEGHRSHQLTSGIATEVEAVQVPPQAASPTGVVPSRSSGVSLTSRTKKL